MAGGSKMKSMRFSTRAQNLLEALTDELGLSEAKVCELGLYALAKLHKISLGDQEKTTSDSEETPAVVSPVDPISDLITKAAETRREYLTFQEAALVLGISLEGVRWRTKHKRLTVYKFSGSRTPLVSRAEVETQAQAEPEGETVPRVFKTATGTPVAEDDKE